MDNYDEDLNENPFFQSLLASCPQLFAQCVLEQWLICVPRRDSLPKYAFTTEDFTHHILKPIRSRKDGNRHWSGDSDLSNNNSLLQPTDRSYSDQSLLSKSESFSDSSDNLCSITSLKGNWNYKTLTDINVEYLGKTLVLDVEVPVPKKEQGPTNTDETHYEKLRDKYAGLVVVPLRKEILFDETFYTNDRRKYKVLCVASPLNSKVDVEDDSFGAGGLGLWNLTSLRDCIDFIWVKGNMKILETYDAYIKLFLHNHPGMENLPLSIQKDLVQTVYVKCLTVAESTGMASLPDNLPLGEFIHQRLKLATETYLLNGVYRSLISAITSVFSSEDAILNKIMRNLAELQPQDLDIQSVDRISLSRARHELGRINSFSSPLGKLTCMKRTLRYLKSDNVAENSSESGGVLSTEELIPIWVYLIVKNPIGNWMAQLEFLRHFRFSSIESQGNDSSFYIVTLEASLEYLRSGRVLGISDAEKDIGIPSDLGDAWLHSVHQSSLETSDHHLGKMFDLIRLGNCTKLEELIEDYEVEKFMKNSRESAPKVIDGSLLCHPLCGCDKCSAICLPVVEESPMVAAVDLATEDGLTLLHVSCIYGRPKIVDLLIGAGANLETQDSQGMTPLHYAASRGHQNALLLLLHAGGSLEPVNNSKNTPLHLAAQNGHEGCVKAIIYYAEHARKKFDISAKNGKGDTPLHFASRWGFQGIVELLAEHGGAINAPNIRHSTPIDCAHDIHILKILQRSMRRRSLVQMNHGDFVNIELVQKEECGGIVMLISEPKEKTEANSNNERSSPDVPNSPLTTRSSSRLTTRANSRSGSRRNSSVAVPVPYLLVPGSAPRSRRISSTRSPFEDAESVIAEETSKCLQNVAEQLKDDPASPDFVKNYFVEIDPTKEEHVRKISVETLEDTDSAKGTLFTGLSSPMDSSGRDLKKLFNAITAGDLPLALFYLGIPAYELENRGDEMKTLNRVSACHPLCPCPRCLAKNAGLGLGLDVRNENGYTPLHLAVQYSLILLIKILIRYGADINAETALEKKTSLDLAMEMGRHDIEDVLKAAGGFHSSSFCPEITDYEK